MRSDRTNSRASTAPARDEHEKDDAASAADDRSRPEPGPLAAVYELSSWERDAAVIELPRRPLRGRDVSVLTNRIAAALVHHEPGWRLPRLSVLARQYDSTSEMVATAISELVAHGLIRHAPGGQFCRASPAHYVLPLGDSMQGLQLRADPVGGMISVKSRTVSTHPVRDDIERALQVACDEPVCIVQLVWAVGGEPAAVTATYLRSGLANCLINETDLEELRASTAILSLTPLKVPGPDGIGSENALLLPSALHLEMQQAPRWAAQALDLSACERAATITVAYDDARDGNPAALTVAVLRPEHFRITVVRPGETGLAGDAGTVGPGWSHVAGDWDF